MSAWNFEHASRDLLDAAVHPERWSDALTTLAGQTGSVGAMLFAVDRRLQKPPATASLERGAEVYFLDDWGPRDLRFEGMPLMARQGVVTDQDFISPERMAREPYYRDFLARYGLKWFAGVGFTARSDPWCLTLQRGPAEGPFQRDETERLKALWRPFSDAATLSRLLDEARVPAMTDALEIVAQAGMVCDQRGSIIEMNERARGLVGPLFDARARSLRFRDSDSADGYACLLRDALSSTPSTDATARSIVVLDAQRRPLVLRAVGLAGSSRFMFLHGAALILVKRLVPTLEAILAERWALTPAQIGIIDGLLSGTCVQDIAAERGIKVDTVRHQLKTIFAKTDTRGQPHLLAWLRLLERSLET